MHARGFSRFRMIPHDFTESLDCKYSPRRPPNEIRRTVRRRFYDNPRLEGLSCLGTLGNLPDKVSRPNSCPILGPQRHLKMHPDNVNSPSVPQLMKPRKEVRTGPLAWFRVWGNPECSGIVSCKSRSFSR